MPRNKSRGGRNNNPSGRNQYSDWGVMEMARERPIAAAAAAAGAAAAGLFLWSKRSQITQQLSDLTDQFGEWKDKNPEMDDTAGLTTSRSTVRSGAGSRSATGTRGRTTTSRQRGMSETGGGNASLGAQTGSPATTTSRTGRGRAGDNS
ncbi:MAG TPA: hypothetical protein VHE36_13045 [Sphingomicrobium sp.]|jgi:hypothetical protein|nr:hypothetical protein [Sphingomicrobium sp.]